MIPISLTLSGFLSYREEVTLDFRPFELACIAGANGAGKSSLLDGITWALFGRARKADESLINIHPDTQAARVVFTFYYEGNLYRVIRSNPRGKTSTLEFQIATSGESALPEPENAVWKTLSERAIRETQQRIEETLRLDYETFVNAAFFLQDKADQFTQQTPARRKAILSNILGLGIWEEYRQRTVQRRKGVETDIAGLDGRLQEIAAELDEEPNRRERLANLQHELAELIQRREAQQAVLENIRKVQHTLAEQQKMVATLARQLESARSQLNEGVVRLADREKERGTYAQLLATAEELRARHDAWLADRKTLAAWEETAARFREQEQRRHQPLTQIESERVRLETDIAVLAPQEQNIVDLRARLPVVEKKIEFAQAERDAAESQLALRSELEEKLQTELKRHAEAKAENPRLRTEMMELNERIERLEGTEGPTCPLCGQDLSPEEREKLVAALRAQGTQKGDRFRENLRLLEESEGVVADLKGEISGLGAANQAFQRQTAILAELSQEQKSHQAQLQEWDEKQEPRLHKMRAALESGEYASRARDQLRKIDAELKEIGYDAAEHERIRQQVAAGESSEAEIRQLERAEAALKPLDREISELEAQIERQRNELEGQQQDHDRAAAALAAAQAGAPNLEQAQRDLLDIKEQENQLLMEVGRAEQKVSVLGDLRARQATLQEERAALTQRAARLIQLERAFGKDGVPALLIEQALPQIEDKANELLERLSGGEMYITFQTQRALKSREDLKETLDIQISDRAGVRDYEMYSGGEAFRVNFAIRLALSEILTKRAGARLQTLVIDEGFGSQDAVGRQRLVEAINMIQGDFAKILVITHIESLKEAFPVRIEVAKGDEGSSLAVVS